MKNKSFGMIVYRNLETGEYKLRLGTDVDFDKVRIMSKEYPTLVIDHFESDLPGYEICGAQAINMDVGDACVRELAHLAASEEMREDLERYMLEIFFMGLEWQKKNIVPIRTI